MNFKTTILLLVLVVAGGALWLFLPGSEPAAETAKPKTPSDATQVKALFDPQPSADDIVRVEVERAGKPTLVFERRDTGAAPGEPRQWEATAPTTMRADEYKVLNVINTMASLFTRSQFEPGTDGAVSAADAGLEPPAAAVTLADKSGKTYAVEVGRKAPLSMDTYIRKRGEKTIYVANREVLPQVAKDLKEYRTQRLLTFRPDEVVRIEVAHENKTYDFSKSPAGEWVINSPVRAVAEGGQITSKILQPLSSLQSAELVAESAENPAAYGLDSPFLTFTLTTQTKSTPPADANEPATTQPDTQPVMERHQITIGGFADLKSERRYVQVAGDPAVVSVAQSSITPLVPNLNDLRQSKLARFNASDVTELEVSANGESATLRKVDGAWQGTGELTALDSFAVNDLLSALSGLTATSFVDEPQPGTDYGLNPPRTTLRATVSGQVEPFELHVGSRTPSGRHAYVQRGNDRSIAVVAEAAADKLAISPITLRAREVFTVPPDQIQRIRIERGPAVFELQRANGQWLLTEPAGAPLNMGIALNLMSDLSRLRGKRVVAKDDVARYGLDQPQMTITFEQQPPAPPQTSTNVAETAPAGAVEHKLYVSRVGEVAYMKRDGDPYIFEVDESVHHIFASELIDPRLFSFKPEDVAGVTIRATGGTLEFTRQDNKWVYPPEPFLKIAQVKVQNLVRDLSQMKAERTLEYRDADLAAAGLQDAPASVTVKLKDGTEIVMNLTQERPGELPRLAGLVSERRIVLLSLEDAQKLMRGVDEYLESTDPNAPDAEAGEGPALPPGMPRPNLPPGVSRPRGGRN